MRDSRPYQGVPCPDTVLLGLSTEASPIINYTAFVKQ